MVSPAPLPPPALGSTAPAPQLLPAMGRKHGIKLVRLADITLHLARKASSPGFQVAQICHDQVA